MGYPVFTVQGNDTDALWGYLQEKMPDHNWEADPHERQKRFFKPLERQILDAKDRISLDEKAIERFAEAMKELLKKK